MRVVGKSTVFSISSFAPARLGGHLAEGTVRGEEITPRRRDSLRDRRRGRSRGGGAPERRRGLQHSRPLAADAPVSAPPPLPPLPPLPPPPLPPLPPPPLPPLPPLPPPLPPLPPPANSHSSTAPAFLCGLLTARYIAPTPPGGEPSTLAFVPSAGGASTHATSASRHPLSVFADVNAPGAATSSTATRPSESAAAHTGPRGAGMIRRTRLGGSTSADRHVSVRPGASCASSPAPLAPPPPPPRARSADSQRARRRVPHRVPRRGHRPDHRPAQRAAHGKIFRHRARQTDFSPPRWTTPPPPPSSPRLAPSPSRRRTRSRDPRTTRTTPPPRRPRADRPDPPRDPRPASARGIHVVLRRRQTNARERRG